MCAIVEKFDPNLLEKFPDTPRSIYQLSNEAIRLYGESVRNECLVFFRSYESALKDTEKKNQELLDFINQNHDAYIFSIWSSNTLALVEHTL